jgi:hypothetical protein
VADSKTTELSEFTPIVTDLVYGVDDPAGTPISGKIVIQKLIDLVKSALGLREVLTANRTYYVDGALGSDSNDGLSSGAGAFATLQKAVDVVTALDTSIYDVIIQLADGTYTGGALFSGPWGGAGSIVIQGNVADDDAVIISTTSDHCVKNTGTLPAILKIQYVKMQTTTVGNCIGNEGIGEIHFKNVVFGDCANYHIYAAAPGAAIRSRANYAIEGNCQRHMDARFGGLVDTGGRTIDFRSNSDCSIQFAQAFVLGTLIANGMTFNDNGYTLTGQRYAVSMNGAIYVGGGGASYFPGDSAGASGSGGQYV